MNTMINLIKIMKMKMNTNTNKNLKNNKLLNRKQVNLQRKYKNKKINMKNNLMKFMMIIVRRRKFYLKIRRRTIQGLIWKLLRKLLVIGSCLRDTLIRIWVRISRKVGCRSLQSNSLLLCLMINHFSSLSNKSNMC